MNKLLLAATVLLFIACNKTDDESSYYMKATVDGQKQHTVYFTTNVDPQTSQLSSISGLFNGYAIGIRLDHSFPSFAEGEYIFRDILPAVITSFTVEVASGKPVVKWTTGEESGLQSFVVERSLNGIDFIQLATVAATNTTSPQQYQLTDTAAHFVSRYYYRLKIVENNGQFQYSPIRVYSNEAAHFAWLGNFNGTKFKGFNGNITIHSHDRSMKLLNGSFAFDVKDSSGKTIQVREGAFHIYY